MAKKLNNVKPIYIDEKLQTKLKIHSAKTNKPMTEIGNEVIGAYLENVKAPKTHLTA